MLSYNEYIFLFGGIQDVTKEKNDVHIYLPSKNEWNKVHTTTNSIYDCSPTLKKSRKEVALILCRLVQPRSQSTRWSPTKSTDS